MNKGVPRERWDWGMSRVGRPKGLVHLGPSKGRNCHEALFPAASEWGQGLCQLGWTPTSLSKLLKTQTVARAVILIFELIRDVGK